MTSPEMEQLPNQEEPVRLDPPVSTVSTEPSSQIPSPTDSQYRTETEAVQYIKTFAQDNGFAAIIKRTNKGRSGNVEAIYMTCDQGQVYHSTAQLRQRAPSRRRGCPFSIRISWHKSDRLWHVKVRDGTHNHGPSLPTSHPSIRRDELAQKTQYIKALLDINMPASMILKQLRHVDPDTVIQRRDIYNLRNRLYQGKLPVSAVGDFRPGTVPKSRRRESSDNQLSGETSTPGAVDESIEQGVGQGVAAAAAPAPALAAPTPVPAVSGDLIHHNHQISHNMTMF